MNQFVGRRKELAVLEEEWTRPSSGFVPIYGRRRVGKSELILKFLQDKKAIYYVGKQAPPELQIREFLRQAAEILEEPLLAGHPAEGWSQALDLVMSRRGDEKIVCVFDEFQWMVEGAEELPSLLQERWDLYS